MYQRETSFHPSIKCFRTLISTDENGSLIHLVISPRLHIVPSPKMSIRHTLFPAVKGIKISRNNYHLQGCVFLTYFVLSEKQGNFTFAFLFFSFNLYPFHSVSFFYTYIVNILLYSLDFR